MKEIIISESLRDVRTQRRVSLREWFFAWGGKIKHLYILCLLRYDFYQRIFPGHCLLLVPIDLQGIETCDIDPF